MPIAMKFKFQEIAMAFDFVSSTGLGENSAVVLRNAGKILYYSELGDLDDFSEDESESEESIEIPHKNDLDLGRELVLDFVQSHIPEDYGHVQEIFSRSGAYSRFKDLLESKSLLQTWYDFENQAQEKSLREWCKDNEIELCD